MKSILVLLLLGVIGVFAEDTTLQTQTQGLTLTEWGHNFPFDKFDTSLGTLTAVHVTVTTVVDSDIIVTNGGASPSNGNVRTAFSLNIDTTGGNNPFITAVTDGGIDYETETLTNAAAYNLATSASVTLSPATKTDSNILDETFTTGAFFNECKGSAGQTFNFIVGTRAATVVTNTGGNTGFDENTLAGATFTVQYTYTPGGGATGDPQIVGFQSQNFQVHGIPDEHFSLISTPNYYVNSRFAYIATGVCNYNDTECFSHPGTYIDQLGFVIEDARVKIVAGSHTNGLVAYLNDQALPVGSRVRLSNDSHVHILSNSRAKVVFPDVSLLVANSDHFFNLGADLTNAQLYKAGKVKVSVAGMDAASADKVISTSYPEFPMHGLLGQTWRNIEWSHSRLYQGEATDYQVTDLFSPDFVFTQYIKQL